MPSIARGLKRPVWDAINRLARVGAVDARSSPGGNGQRNRQGAYRRADRSHGLRCWSERLPFGGRRRNARCSRRSSRWAGERRFAICWNSSSSPRRAARTGEATACGCGRSSRPARPLRRYSGYSAASDADSTPGGGGQDTVGSRSGRWWSAFRCHRKRKDPGVSRGHSRRRCRDGQGAIILVPEIGLTPQTVSRVRGVFGNDVAVLHSGLSEGERADAWRALRSGVEAGGGGSEVGGFRAGAEPGRDRDRRGARSELQERRSTTLSRPRCGDGPSAISKARASSWAVQHRRQNPWRGSGPA